MPPQFMFAQTQSQILTSVSDCGLSVLGKLARSFRAWKSFTRKSVQDKTLKHKAERHYNTALKRNAVLKWKSFIHLRFRIKVIGPFLLPRPLGKLKVSLFHDFAEKEFVTDKVIKTKMFYELLGTIAT